MPSTSEKQARTMAAAAHDPAFARRAGIPQKVARDFNQADKGGGLLSRAMAHRLRKGSKGTGSRSAPGSAVGGGT